MEILHSNVLSFILAASEELSHFWDCSNWLFTEISEKHFAFFKGYPSTQNGFHCRYISNLIKRLHHTLLQLRTKELTFTEHKVWDQQLKGKVFLDWFSL